MIEKNPENASTKEEQKKEKTSQVWGFVGLITGIIGLILSLLVFGLAFSIFAIVSFFLQKKRGKSNMANAGLILGVLGILVGVVVLFMATVVDTPDFGSFVPNRLELSGDIQGDPTQIVANSDTNELQFVFIYIGPKSVTIDLGDVIVVGDESGKPCSGEELRNIRTGRVDTTFNDESDTILFTNGQKGLVKMECEGQLEKNELFEGNVEIKTKSEDGTVIPVNGRIRVKVT